VVRGGLDVERWTISGIGRWVQCNERKERYAGGDESVCGGQVSGGERRESSEWR